MDSVSIPFVRYIIHSFPLFKYTAKKNQVSSAREIISDIMLNDDSKIVLLLTFQNVDFTNITDQRKKFLKSVPSPICEFS